MTVLPFSSSNAFLSTSKSTSAPPSFTVDASSGALIFALALATPSLCLSILDCRRGLTKNSMTALPCSFSCAISGASIVPAMIPSFISLNFLSLVPGLIKSTLSSTMLSEGSSISGSSNSWILLFADPTNDNLTFSLTLISPFSCSSSITMNPLCLIPCSLKVWSSWTGFPS